MREGSKLEAVDFVIAVLVDHERKLDEMIKRLEAITPTLEKEMNR